MGVSRGSARAVRAEGLISTPNRREPYGALHENNPSGATGTRVPRALRRQGDGVLDAFVERVVQMMAIRNPAEIFLTQCSAKGHSDDDGGPVSGCCTIYHGGGWVEIHTRMQGDQGEIAGQARAPWESPMRYDW